MNSRPHPSSAVRPRRLLLVALALVLVAAGVFALQQSLSAASASNTTAPERVSDGAAPAGAPGAPLGEADGMIRGGAQPSVFDEESPAVAKLDPDLLAALQEAAKDAGDDGVTFKVNSGWRSAAFQEQILRDAIAEYGSAEEAARWVATPETSAHVLGKAVDLGSAHALDWLSQHGDRYGLCQIFANEPWHYELRPKAVQDGCPTMYADPTEKHHG